APPMPYRVAGRVMHDGVTQIILARGDVVLTVREGDTLDGAYQVEKIQGERVTMLYTPLGVREDLAVNSALAFDSASPPAAQVAAAAPAAAGATASGPASLRWEGPQRVSAGSTFDVSLKLTSAEAVRAAPLQLQYDAKVLEPVAVRAGGFFSDGLFSYRVNPAGSIFIGASGKGAAALDAEFLVVRFKPIGALGPAELKISSLSLQDPSGRAIAIQQPAAFRTVITQ
ncbi:MAG TPA: cohesin domain-containing protein, partial [Burkholderiales bacterium]|nr:cohesin domain-containing protein [Burkholderiales bacterium]